MKESNDTIGNGTRDLPTCSAVPQQTALQHTLTHIPVPIGFYYALNKDRLNLIIGNFLTTFCPSVQKLDLMSPSA